MPLGSLACDVPGIPHEEAFVPPSGGIHIPSHADACVQYHNPVEGAFLVPPTAGFHTYILVGVDVSKYHPLDGISVPPSEWFHKQVTVGASASYFMNILLWRMFVCVPGFTGAFVPAGRFSIHRNCSFGSFQ